MNPFSRGEVSFRVIHDEDKDFLIRVYADSRAWELAHTHWDKSEWDDFVRRQYEYQDLHYKRSYIGALHRIIQLDGQDIGRLIVNRRDDAMHIIDLTILESHQGKGIGTDILKSLMNEAHNGRVPVLLSVEQGNPAIALYQRLGFQRVKEEGRHISMRWTPMIQNREI